MHWASLKVNVEKSLNFLWCSALSLFVSYSCIKPSLSYCEVTSNYSLLMLGDFLYLHCILQYPSFTFRKVAALKLLTKLWLLLHHILPSQPTIFFHPHCQRFASWAPYIFPMRIWCRLWNKELNWVTDWMYTFQEETISFKVNSIKPNLCSFTFYFTLNCYNLTNFKYYKLSLKFILTNCCDFNVFQSCLFLYFVPEDSLRESSVFLPFLDNKLSLA